MVILKRKEMSALDVWQTIVTACTRAGGQAMHDNRANIQRFAELAGVSRTTLYRLKHGNDGKPVSDNLLHAVCDGIKKLGFECIVI